LIELKNEQERMKRINMWHKKYKKNPQSIIESDLSEEDQQYIIQWVPRFEYYTQPFQRFELSNNNATIKNTEKRIAELEAKENFAQLDPKEITVGDAKIIMNYQLDRIQIFNPERPPRETIEQYKKHGLKWSPYHKCWQRKITANAKWVIGRLFDINL